MAQDSIIEADSGTKTSQLRLLVLAPSPATPQTPPVFPSFLERLTGTVPSPDITTFAGYTSHPSLHLKTRYYEADVGIWCDELPPVTHQIASGLGSTTSTDEKSVTKEDANAEPSESEEDQSSLSAWQEQMLSDAAREVRDVIGGIIVLFPLTPQASTPSSQSMQQLDAWIPYIESATALRDAVEEESGRDVASVVLLQDMSPPATPAPPISIEQIEEECLSSHGLIGWDYVFWKPTPSSTNTTSTSPAQPQTTTITATPSDKQVTARNEYGEKTGFPRVIEVLEQVDWTATSSTLDPSADEALDEMLGPDPLNFIDSTDSKHAHTVIPTSAHANLRTTPGIRVETESDSLLANEHNEFQREMLGLKMAMLDIDNETGRTGTSSLAGEFDVGDFGIRTPMPPTTSRELGDAATASRPSVKTDAEAEGDGVQVEQLSGLMERVVAMRDAAGGMSSEERERFARREVAKIMKELS